MRSTTIGPIIFRNLIDLYGSALKTIKYLPERARRVGNKSFRMTPEHTVREEWEALKKLGGDFVFLDSPDYPNALAAISNPPPVLSYVGDNLDLLHKSCVAIVGSRYPSANAIQFTQALAYELAGADIVTVSGLARGIDTACHIGSLQSKNGATVAVLANGIDICYPQQNRNLYKKIAQEGLLISESPLGRKPFGSAFPQRNRIISGLSSAAIIVEAGQQSGSLITARYCLEQGREVMAVPSTPSDQRALGCLDLIRQGAQICTCANDVFNAIDHATIPLREKKDTISCEASLFDDFDDSETQIHQKLLSLLGPTPTDFTQLCQYLDAPVPMIRASLLDHEIAGLVRRTVGDRYMLS